MTRNMGLFASEPASADGSIEEQWDEVVASLRDQHPRITALESKAMYVFGMMRHLFEATGWALDHPDYCRDGTDRSPQPFYFPAYELASGAVELLGHCVMSESDFPGIPDGRSGAVWNE